VNQADFFIGSRWTINITQTPPPEIGSMDEPHRQQIPLARRGTPEDIGRAVTFLYWPWEKTGYALR